MVEKVNSRRRKAPRVDERAVWAAAAGRCTLCNRSVLENEDLGVAVPIGELAHNIGWGARSPRGAASSLTAEQRAAAENLLLLCRNCHKPIDAKGYIGLYSSEELLERKREHEARVHFLTGIDSDRRAHVLRLVGEVRNVAPALSYDAVLAASTASGLFPARLPDSFRSEVEVDLLGVPGAGTPEYYHVAARKVDEQVGRLFGGVAAGEVKRLAVFAFARIPVLVYLGAKLDDKIETLIFQRQRADSVNAWKWPAAGQPPCDFEYVLERPGDGGVGVLLNLSGTIRLDELPAQTKDLAIYSVRPVAPAESSPMLISSPEALLRFDHTLRRFLAFLEREHGKLASVAVFPAVPVSAAVTVGRVLMPNVSPRLEVFDRDETGTFVPSLTVSRRE